VRRAVALRVALLGVGALLVSASASAWDSPEHEAFGKTAIHEACASTPNADACSAANQQFAGNAVAAPDYCHSYWFSTVGIAVNGTDASDRAGCGIRFGTPLPHPNATWQEYSYLLITNANHFGDNTEAHWKLFHTLAKQAAQIGAQLASHYMTAPDPSLTSPNPLIAQCTKTALGIEGFSLHYMTDRTAAGHAWDPEPRYVDRSNIGMSGLRSCFHGQPLGSRVGGTIGTLFDCVDGLTDSKPAIGDGHILQGLGDTGRNFGGDQSGSGLWLSDGAMSSTNFTTKNPAQVKAADGPSEAAFAEIVSMLSGGAATDPAWTDTFVSDHDFCSVAISECCRASSVGGPGSLGTCSTCTPDITDAKIKASCPVDQVVSEGVSGADWVPLQSNGLLKNSVYYAHLNFGSGGGTGISVARSLALTGSLPPASTIHPDANWDRTNDVVTLSGCALFDIQSANLPVAPLDGSSVSATVTYEGNPTFPLTVHWRPNTTASQGTLCTAPAGLPHLCDPHDFAISTKPAGTTPTSPKPLTLSPWACTGASSTAAPATGHGFLYITDANGSWTTAYPGDLQCGGSGADGGTDGGGSIDASLDAFDATHLDAFNGTHLDAWAGTFGDANVADVAWSGSFDATDDGPVLRTEAGLIEGSCTHDVCTAGARLGQQCDECTLRICAADPYCCDTYWGASCFTDVQKLCGATCPP
jgi:hypothetical protein